METEFNEAETEEIISILKTEFSTAAFAVGRDNIKLMLKGEDVIISNPVDGQNLDYSFAFTIIKNALEIAALVATVYSGLKKEGGNVQISLEEIIKIVNQSNTKVNTKSNSSLIKKIVDLLTKRK